MKKPNPPNKPAALLNSASVSLQPSAWRIWLLTVRPKTLTATLVPIAVGTALAWAEQGGINYLLALYALAFGLCIQIATNFFNDVEDWRKNADGDRRTGPRRAIQQGLATPRQLALAAVLLLFFAALLSLPLVAQGGAAMAYLVVASMLCSYAYTGGPLPLAYWGLGDLFVLLFFGFAATIAPYYLQTGSISLLSILAGIQIGLLATNLIAINNLRDHVEDEAVKKNTLAVRFGEQFTRVEIAFCSSAPFFLLPIWYMAGFKVAAALPLALFPIGNRLIEDISSTPPGALYNAFLARAALFHLLFGGALVIGILS